MAGKAHPADQAGQALIQQWMQFIQRSEVRLHVSFLGDYDMHVGEHLVQGVGVWLNTPRRPWEASGTSGMKVLVNGGINLSELDCWWAEAYTPEVGWALGDGQEHGDDPAWNTAEAEALYDLLEREVIPEFYRRDEQGIPAEWVNRMRESMARLTPRFSTNRAVRKYTGQHDLPAAVAYRERAADKGKIGVELVNWRHALEQKWAALRFGEVKAKTDGGQHVFEAQVYLDDLDPGAVRGSSAAAQAEVQSRGGGMGAMGGTAGGGMDGAGMATGSSWVNDAKIVVAQQLELPPGYRLQWTGQYKFMAELEARLQTVIPLTLALVVGLLFLSMRGWPQTWLVLLTLPFAIAGSICCSRCSTTTCRPLCGSV